MPGETQGGFARLSSLFRDGRYWPGAETRQKAEDKTASRLEAARRQNRVIISATDPFRTAVLNLEVSICRL